MKNVLKKARNFVVLIWASLFGLPLAGAALHSKTPQKDGIFKISKASGNLSIGKRGN